MKATDDINKLRKPALAIIGLVVVFFTIMVLMDDGATEQPITTKQSVVTEPEPKQDKISDMSLYFDCKPMIQAQLNNPKSFDPKALSVKYNFIDDKHVIGFDFYAKNGFGGEVMQQAICSFDADGNILEYGIV